MESNRVSVNSPSNQVDEGSASVHLNEAGSAEQEDPFSLGPPSIALLGLTIAIATVGVPLAAVLTDRPLRRDLIVPTALELDGSQPSTPVSYTHLRAHET